MVIGTILLIAAAPGLLGTQEAIRQSQQKEKREEHRARRCGLIATCVKSSIRGREVDGRQIVLVNNRLYVDTGTADDSSFGHPFAGYYLPYPDKKFEGLVTTITDVAPVLNWIYVDKDTYQVKYGVRANAQPNLHGPFDCTRQDRRLTFEGWEGFVAVEEEPYLWAIYFDRDDNGLKGKVAPGTRVLEIELTRKERRWKKDPQVRKEEQGTAHAVNENITLHPTPQPAGEQKSEEKSGDLPLPEHVDEKKVEATVRYTPSTPPQQQVRDQQIETPPPESPLQRRESITSTHQRSRSNSASGNQNRTSRLKPLILAASLQQSARPKLKIPTRTSRADSMSPESKSNADSAVLSSPVSISDDNISSTTEASSWAESSERAVGDSRGNYTPMTTPSSSPRKIEKVKTERTSRQQVQKEILDKSEHQDNEQGAKKMDLRSHKALPKPPPKTPQKQHLRPESNSPYSPRVPGQKFDWKQSQQTIRALTSKTTLHLNMDSSARFNPLEQALLKLRRMRSSKFREYYAKAKVSMTKKMNPILRERIRIKTHEKSRGEILEGKWMMRREKKLEGMEK